MGVSSSNPPLAVGELPDADNLPEGADKDRAVRAMFDSISGRYDLVNRIMTFRLDVGWRRKSIRALKLPVGSSIADLACGTGDLCRELQAAGFEPVGFDFSFGMLQEARTSAPLIHADALCLPMPEDSVDGVTCGFALRNFADLQAFFDELGRVVRPAGRVSLLDVAEPPNPVLRFGHKIYFGKLVPLIGGLLSSRDAYRYLPKSVSYLPSAEAMLEMLSAAGFEDTRHDLLSGGITRLITATRSQPAP